MIGEFGLSDEWKNRIGSHLVVNPKYSEDLATESLIEIHTATKGLETGYRFHGELWKFILKINCNPLPISLGMDLCNEYRDLANTIANSKQYLEVYFCAADKSKYARSRLCIRLFIESIYSVKELQLFISRYGKKNTVRILKNKKPSSDSKYTLFSEEEIDYMKEKWDDELDSQSKKKIRKRLKRDNYENERSEYLNLKNKRKSDNKK